MNCTKGEWGFGSRIPLTKEMAYCFEIVDTPESRANAQLIAKAPKMYEAIQSAIVEIEDGSPHHAHFILVNAINEMEGK